MASGIRELEDDELKGDGKKRRFKPLEAVRKWFGKGKRKSKDDAVSVVALKAKSTTALHEDDTDDDDGGFKSVPYQPKVLGAGNRSISEDSVFSQEQRETSRKVLKKIAISDENISKATFQAELFSKLHKRRSQNSDDDDGLPQSPTPPITTADVIMGAEMMLPSLGKSPNQGSTNSISSMDGSETDDGPLSDRWKSTGPTNRAQLTKQKSYENEGPVGFETLGKIELLKSDAAKDRISIKPRTRKASHHSRKKKEGVSPHSLPKLTEESPTKITPDEFHLNSNPDLSSKDPDLQHDSVFLEESLPAHVQESLLTSNVVKPSSESPQPRSSEQEPEIFDIPLLQKPKSASVSYMATSHPEDTPHSSIDARPKSISIISTSYVSSLLPEEKKVPSQDARPKSSSISYSVCTHSPVEETLSRSSDTKGFLESNTSRGKFIKNKSEQSANLKHLGLESSGENIVKEQKLKTEMGFVQTVGHVTHIKTSSSSPVSSKELSDVQNDINSDFFSLLSSPPVTKSGSAAPEAKFDLGKVQIKKDPDVQPKDNAFEDDVSSIVRPSQGPFTSITRLQTSLTSAVSQPAQKEHNCSKHDIISITSTSNTSVVAPSSTVQSATPQSPTVSRSETDYANLSPPESKREGLRPTESNSPVFSPKDDYKQRRQNRSKTLPEQPIGKEEQFSAKVQRAASHRIDPSNSQTASPETSPALNRFRGVGKGTQEGDKEKPSEPEWFALARKKTNRQNSSDGKEISGVTVKPNVELKETLTISLSELPSESKCDSPSKTTEVASTPNVTLCSTVNDKSDETVQIPSQRGSLKITGKLNTGGFLSNRVGSVKASPKSDLIYTPASTPSIPSTLPQSPANKPTVPAMPTVTPSTLPHSPANKPTVPAMPTVTPSTLPHSPANKPTVPAMPTVTPSTLPQSPANKPIMPAMPAMTPTKVEEKKEEIKNPEPSPAKDVPKWKAQNVRSAPPSSSSSNPTPPLSFSRFPGIKPQQSSASSFKLPTTSALPTPTFSPAAPSQVSTKVEAKVSTPGKSASQSKPTSDAEQKIEKVESKVSTPGKSASQSKPTSDAELKIEKVESKVSTPGKSASQSKPTSDAELKIEKEKLSNVPAWRANLEQKKKVVPPSDIKIELIESTTSVASSSQKKEETSKKEESSSKVPANTVELQSDQCRGPSAHSRQSKVLDIVKNFQNLKVST